MNAQATTLMLLAARASDATICPSEVARVLTATGGAGVDWRDEMPALHAAVDRLLVEGKVRLSWKGRTLPARSGPYRIGHGDRA